MEYIPLITPNNGKLEDIYHQAMQQSENMTSHRRSRSFSLPPEDLLNVRSILNTMPLEASASNATNSANEGPELQRWPTPPELECAVFDDEPLRASVEASRNVTAHCLTALPAMPQSTVTTTIEGSAALAQQQAASQGATFHFSRFTSTWHGIHRPRFPSRRSSKTDEEGSNRPTDSAANVVQAFPEPTPEHQQRKRPSLPKLFRRLSDFGRQEDDDDDDGRIMTVADHYKPASRKRSFHFDIHDLHMPYFPGATMLGSGRLY